MSSLWTELLFLHGHIADAQLAKRLSTPSVPIDSPVPATASPTDKSRKPSQCEWVIKLSKRICLGIGDGTLCMQ